MDSYQELSPGARELCVGRPGDEVCNEEALQLRREAGAGWEAGGGDEAVGSCEVKDPEEAGRGGKHVGGA